MPSGTSPAFIQKPMFFKRESAPVFRKINMLMIVVLGVKSLSADLMRGFLHILAVAATVDSCRH
jgi:hypothetical protein